MKSVNLIATLTLAAGSAVAGDSIEWLPATERDLVADGLTTQLDAIPASAHTETSSMSFTWPASADRLAEPAPAVMSESRQYWHDTNSHALSEGISLPISAPGAVIRLSALDSGSTLKLDRDQLELSINGQALEDSALDRVASGKEMREQGLAVPEDSLAIKLPADIEAGTLQLRLQQTGNKIPMVIHVYEPDSPWTASLATGRQSLLAGQDLAFELVLTDGRQELEIDRVQALLVSPDVTESWELQRNAGGKLQGTAPLTPTTAPGLYEAHVYAEHDKGDITIRRDLKLAVGIAPATARFTGQVMPASGGLSMNIGLEAAIDGRYQVNGEIYGTNRSGQLEPLAFAQSAATVSAGHGSIQLEVDASTINASELGAPFEVRNLQLLDQGRMYMLEERAHAIRINDRLPPSGPGDRIER